MHKRQVDIASQSSHRKGGIFRTFFLFVATFCMANTEAQDPSYSSTGHTSPGVVIQIEEPKFQTQKFMENHKAVFKPFNSSSNPLIIFKMSFISPILRIFAMIYLDSMRFVIAHRFLSMFNTFWIGGSLYWPWPLPVLLGGASQRMPTLPAKAPKSTQKERPSPHRGSVSLWGFPCPFFYRGLHHAVIRLKLFDQEPQMPHTG